MIRNKLLIRITLGLVLVMILLGLLHLAYIISEPASSKNIKIILIAKEESEIFNGLINYFEDTYAEKHPNQGQLKIIAYFTHGVVGRVNYFLDKHRNDEFVLGYIILLDSMEIEGINFTLTNNKLTYFVNSMLMNDRLKNKQYSNVNYIPPSTVEVFELIKYNMVEKHFSNICIIAEYDAISVNIALELYDLFRTRKYKSLVTFSEDECVNREVLVLINHDINVSNLSLLSKKFKEVFIVTNFKSSIYLDTREENVHMVWKEILEESYSSELNEFKSLCKQISLLDPWLLNFMTYKAITQLINDVA